MLASHPAPRGERLWHALASHSLDPSPVGMTSHVLELLRMPGQRQLTNALQVGVGAY